LLEHYLKDTKNIKYNRMICWVTKTHKKLIEKTLPPGTIFVDSIDDIDQGENDIVIISTSKITSMKIAEKIRKLKDPYFLEKKGDHTYNMMMAMENSKHWSMLASCEINSILFDT
jgi:hypothetical protein